MLNQLKWRSVVITLLAMSTASVSAAQEGTARSRCWYRSDFENALPRLTMPRHECRP
jgi:hypothetical protein